MGLSVSDAVWVLLTRVAAEQAMPFELRVPNAETAAAMKDARGWKLPKNRRTPSQEHIEDVPIRDLDCLVIKEYLKVADEKGNLSFQTVRGAFWEGEKAFPGAEIRMGSHIQPAVRDQSCILGVFRPQLEQG